MRLLLATVLIVTLAAPAASADEVVRAKDSGRLVSLETGERLTVRLQECGPCGYSWVAARSAGTVLRRVSTRYVDPPQDGTVGGPGTRVLVYRATGAGSAVLQLAYRGPDGSVDGGFRLRIRVG